MLLGVKGLALALRPARGPSESRCQSPFSPKASRNLTYAWVISGFVYGFIEGKGRRGMGILAGHACLGWYYTC